jgi:C1A family cysteine protease
MKQADKFNLDFDVSKLQFSIKPEKYPDPRNWRLTSGISNLPESVDLSSECGPILNQCELNSCQSFAVAKAFTQLAIKRNLDVDPSELYIYYKTRELEGKTKYNVGAYIFDAVKALIKSGPSMEQYMPYSLEFTKKPNFTAELASQYIKFFKIAQRYYQVDKSDLKGILASGSGIVFGTYIFGSTFNPILKGVVPMPDKKESALGAHAMFIVGYDDSTGYYKVANSLGILQGDKGYNYFSYDFINKCGFDFYVIL